jgi:hypothetical protein
MTNSAMAPARPTEDADNTAWALRQLEEALRGLRFGQVTITVQDGVVVQVERTERRRFPQKKAGRTAG